MKLLKTPLLLERRRGISKDSEYCLQQSSSRPREATVLIAPAASQASWAEEACSFLFDWSLRTTTRKRMYPAEMTSG